MFQIFSLVSARGMWAWKYITDVVTFLNGKSCIVYLSIIIGCITCIYFMIILYLLIHSSFLLYGFMKCLTRFFSRVRIEFFPINILSIDVSDFIVSK